MHTTKDGLRIKLEDLSDNHLSNIIKMINYKAKRGVVVKYYGGYSTDEFYYDEKELYGQDVLNFFHYDKYTEELIRRKGEESLFHNYGVSF